MSLEARVAEAIRAEWTKQRDKGGGVDPAVFASVAVPVVLAAVTEAITALPTPYPYEGLADGPVGAFQRQALAVVDALGPQPTKEATP